jgi:hypothetical protein
MNSPTERQIGVPTISSAGDLIVLAGIAEEGAEVKDPLHHPCVMPSAR